MSCAAPRLNRSINFLVEIQFPSRDRSVLRVVVYQARASNYLSSFGIPFRSKPPLRQLPEEFEDVDRLVSTMSFELPDGKRGAWIQRTFSL